MSSSQFRGSVAATSFDSKGIDPSRLTTNGSNMNNNNINFGSMGHSYTTGNSGIADDELEQLLDDNQFSNYTNSGFNANDQGNFYGNNVSVSHQQNIPAQIYSHTPNDAPIQSPFAHNNFNYNQYDSPMRFGSIGMQNGMHNGIQRKAMERQASDSRSPMTPRMVGLHIGTPDSIQQQALLNQQAKMASGQWDGTPGSGSWMDSPLPSPQGHSVHHPQITEIMAGKHGSLPAKMEGAHGGSLPTFHSQEAKKKRRRESHNLVERRRRDNINERIQDLSKLVPQHRLEDEKVRKHLNANGPMSPHGVSPPQATSLLAGGSGRRATAGTITQGLPQEEKEKGPNKGDILNGSVAWCRDLMWMASVLDRRQEELRLVFQDFGRPWPFESTDEEDRMLSELRYVVDRNGYDNFSYSRGQGTGLRVPNFTNWAGESLDGDNDIPIKADPGSAESDMWFHNGGDSGRASLSIKEEDELGMDIG